MATEPPLPTHPSGESTEHRYLLDTSALRALPTRTLRRFDPPAETSSYCFYELVCHLDTDDFARRKGIVLKCRETRILDDPCAEFDRHFGVDPRPTQEQVPAGSIIGCILDRLALSRSLSEFYAQNVLDGEGNARLLRDSVKRVNEILHQEELKFEAFVQGVIDVLQQGHIDLASDQSCNNAIMGLVHGQAEVLRQKGVSNPDISEIDDMKYLYYGYVFERAVHYFSRGSKIDHNDYEDASIIMHMRLTQPTVLVTNDKNTIEAIRKILGRLTALGFGNEYEVGANRTITTSEISWL